MRLGRALGWAGTAQVDGLHAALLACYRAPRRVLRAGCGTASRGCSAASRSAWRCTSSATMSAWAPAW